jgi:hypothetical protein
VYYDYWHVMVGTRYDPSTPRSSPWTTRRSLRWDDPSRSGRRISASHGYARQVGVKAVGLDFIYQVSAEEWLAN